MAKYRPVGVGLINLTRGIILVFYTFLVSFHSLKACLYDEELVRQGYLTQTEQYKQFFAMKSHKENDSRLLRAERERNLYIGAIHHDQFHFSGRRLDEGSSNAANTKHEQTLVINALDTDSIIHAVAFFDALSPALLSKTELRLFAWQSCYNDVSADVKSKLQNHKVTVSFYTYSPLPNKNIGRPNPPEEMVTSVMESLYIASGMKLPAQDVTNFGEYSDKDSTILPDADNKNHATIVVSIQSGSVPMPTKSFADIFDRLRKEQPGTSSGTPGSSAKAAVPDILLLGKNQRMSSVSDFHDLIVVGLATSRLVVRQWLHNLHAVYMHHATNREAYTLLDPRPAIMEASVRMRKNTTVYYMNHNDICAHVGKRGDNQNENKHHDHRCDKSNPFITISCKNADHVCAVVDVPTAWKHTIEHNVAQTWQDKTTVGPDKWKTELLSSSWHGALRFRGAPKNDTPRAMCWETGGDEETPPLSRIYKNFDESRPYEKPNPPPKGKLSAVILTGSSASARELERRLYPSLSMGYYCKRHGYKCIHSFSNQFAAYFTHDQFDLIKANMAHTSYFRGIMSKTIMLVDAMFQHPDHEWIVWTDDDMFINPHWAFMPLDAFLDEVPADKVYVAANYRSAFTNVFIVRNNEAGRRLVFDWIAVSMSGYIECHGFDQAAIGTLILLRLYGKMLTKPFGHTCLYDEENGEGGCNNKGDWSCDFKFERDAYRAGFKTKMSYFYGMKMSSYSKGCANEFFPDFYVIAETDKRPRLQCGLCSRLYEIESTGHWDGILGGGNDALRRNAVNGWFFNHKTEFLFWESYLEPKNCKRLDFVPPCVPQVDHLLGGGDGGGVGGGGGGGGESSDKNAEVNHEERLKRFQGRQFISLSDGYAIDVDKGQYCKITNEGVLASQRAYTYMKEYPALIQAAESYTDESWRKSYISTGGGEGRFLCHEGENKCQHGEGEDGQGNREKRRGEDEDKFFEPEDYCEKHCKRVQVPAYDGTDKTRTVVDCRTELDILEEKRRNINQDTFENPNPKELSEEEKQKIEKLEKELREKMKQEKGGGGGKV